MSAAPITRALTPSRWRSFAGCHAAVAAVEFAFIAPVLLLLLLAGFDVGRFVLATQRVERVAGSVAQMLAETPESNSPNLQHAGDGVVTGNDLLFYWNSAMFTYPDVLAVANAQTANWWNLLSVQMASVYFTPTPANCTTTCTYVPKVLWSLGARTCGSTITPVSDTAGYSPTTLPSDLFGEPASLSGPHSVIVVDVAYTWTPTIGAAYLPSIPIVRSAFLAPRTVLAVEAQPNNGIANPCP